MQKRRNIFNIFFLTILLVCLSFVWQGDIGFILSDEGFLWYGVQRVLMGEVPIRDFMAYDPGRYYWSSIFLSLFQNKGILNLRVVVAIFQAVGLFLGLLLIAQSQPKIEKRDTLFLILASITLIVWMYPRHKLFDVSLSIFLIGSLSYLISNPFLRRYLIAGVCVGFIGFFGRNHAVYGLISSLGVIAWLSIQNHSNISFIKGTMYWSLGAVIGFAPIIMMSIFIPGFAIAFWDSILFLFEIKETNLPLPVPWPWTVNFFSISFVEAARRLLVGLFFISTLLFAGLSIIWVFYQRFKNKKVPPVLVATAFLALPYAHYAFSRADVSHLAQGIFPMLIGTFVFSEVYVKKYKYLIAITLFSISFFVMHVYHPGWQCFASKKCVDEEIAGDTLQINQKISGDINLLRELAVQFAFDDQAFIAAPFWPGAYALLERKSPMWEIFPLFPRDEDFEKKEIERIKTANLGFVIIQDHPLDNREDLRFKYTHPLIYQYILENFEPVSISKNTTYKIFKARGESK